MAFGLSSTGFSRKRLADIKEEIEDDLRSTFGPYINTLPGSVFSQLVGVFAEREASIWELAEATYNSQYPDTAEGAALDNVVALTGITRLQSTKSKIVGQLLFGTAGTVIPAGTILSVSGNASSRFVTDADVTLVAGTDEVQHIAFSSAPVAGTWKLKYLTDETTALAYNANAAAVQAALNALPLLSGVTVAGNYTSGFDVTFAGADGKQDHPALVVSQNSLSVTVTVSTTTGGVAQGQVDCTAETAGPTSAYAHTLSVIETPVTGLDSTRNPSDAVVGRDEETDAELRLRRGNSLQVSGAGTVEAIRSKLQELEEVTAAIVFENATDVEDAEGRPAKSFEAVVQGGADQTILDTLFEVKPAGIQAYGSVTGTVVDSMGVSHDVAFSRPTAVPIYLELDVTTTSEAPGDAAQIVEEAILAYADTLGIGDDVIVYPKLVGVLDQFSWITDVVTRIGTALSPTLDNNITIGPAEVAEFDTTRVTVNIL